MITGSDIQKYVVSNFHEEYHQAVLNQIFKSKKLIELFNTAEGQAIFSDAIDGLVKSLQNLVKAVAVGEEDNRIKTASMEVAFYQTQIRRWAAVLMDGDKHLNAIKENVK